MPRMVSLLVSALAIAGCGGRLASQPERPDAEADAATVDAPEDLDPHARCPASPPVVGTPCTPRSDRDSYCSFGAEQLPDCRDVYRCSVARRTWQRMDRCATPKDGCPLAPPPAESECDTEWAHCGWDRSHCLCIRGQWACEPLPASCPGVAPNAGDPCTSGSCDYSIFMRCPDCGNKGFAAVCRDGTWEYATFPGGV